MCKMNRLASPNQSPGFQNGILPFAADQTELLAILGTEMSEDGAKDETWQSAHSDW